MVEAIIPICMVCSFMYAGLQINARLLAGKGYKLQLASGTAHTARPIGELWPAPL